MGNRIVLSDGTDVEMRADTNRPLLHPDGTELGQIEPLGSALFRLLVSEDLGAVCLKPVVCQPQYLDAIQAPSTHPQARHPAAGAIGHLEVPA